MRWRGAWRLLTQRARRSSLCADLLRGFGVVSHQPLERTTSSALIAPFHPPDLTRTPGGDCWHFPVRRAASVGHCVPRDWSWYRIGQNTAHMVFAADNRVWPSTHLRCRLQAADRRLAAFRGIKRLSRGAIERGTGRLHASRQTDRGKTRQRIPKHLKPPWSASANRAWGFHLSPT